MFGLGILERLRGNMKSELTIIFFYIEDDEDNAYILPKPPNSQTVNKSGKAK